MSFFFYTHFIKIYTMNRGDTYMTPEERKELQERTKEAIKNKGFLKFNINDTPNLKDDNSLDG